MEVLFFERNGNKTKLSSLQKSAKHWVDLSNTLKTNSWFSPTEVLVLQSASPPLMAIPSLWLLRPTSVSHPWLLCFHLSPFWDIFFHCIQRDTLLKHKTNRARLLIKTVHWLPFHATWKPKSTQWPLVVVQHNLAPVASLISYQLSLWLPLLCTWPPWGCSNRPGTCLLYTGCSLCWNTESR